MKSGKAAGLFCITSEILNFPGNAGAIMITNLVNTIRDATRMEKQLYHHPLKERGKGDNLK